MAGYEDVVDLCSPENRGSTKSYFSIYQLVIAHSEIMWGGEMVGGYCGFGGEWLNLYGNRSMDLRKRSKDCRL